MSTGLGSYDPTVECGGCSDGADDREAARAWVVRDVLSDELVGWRAPFRAVDRQNRALELEFLGGECLVSQLRPAIRDSRHSDPDHVHRPVAIVNDQELASVGVKERSLDLVDLRDGSHLERRVKRQ